MRVHLLAVALIATALNTTAQWTEYALPTTSGGGIVFDHLNDGRFVISDGGALIVQDAFGAGDYSPHAASAGGFFPAFMETAGDNTGYVGPGNFGAGDLFAFNAGSPGDSTVTSVGTAIQDYDAALRDDSGLFLAGGNGSGSFTGPFGSSTSNAISYIDLGDGSSTLLIDNVSAYSAAIAVDTAGSLYVGNNDNGEVRKFSSSQLTTGINGGPIMEFSDGEFVYDFGEGGNIGSLAVDGLGRVWSAGFLQIGLQVYDPLLDTAKALVPGMANANYAVATFSQGGNEYVSYVNASAFFSAGATANYGIIDAANIMVPEPGSSVMLILGAALLAGWHRLNHPQTKAR